MGGENTSRAMTVWSQICYIAPKIFTLSNCSLIHGSEVVLVLCFISVGTFEQVSEVWSHCVEAIEMDDEIPSEQINCIGWKIIHLNRHTMWVYIDDVY